MNMITIKLQRFQMRFHNIFEKKLNSGLFIEKLKNIVNLINLINTRTK